MALIVSCQSLQGLTFGAVALFLPLIRHDVGLTFSEAGTLAVASQIVYAAMQVPSGYLADRYGPKRLFVIGLLGVNTLSLVFASLDSYVLLLANLTLYGFFRSLVFAPGLLLISEQFPPNRRATGMGLYVAGGFTSNIVLSSLGPILVGPLGWRLLFVIFSVGGLFVVSVFVKLGSGTRKDGSSAPVSIRELPRLVRHPVMWFAGVVQFVRLAVVTAMNFWLPTYLVVDKGFSLQGAGLVVALGALVTAPSNSLGGYLSDRLGRPVLVVATSVTAIAVTLVLLAHVHAPPLVVLVVAVQAIFVQFYFGPLFSIPIRVLGTRTAGLASGFSNGCANLGGLTFAYTFGVVKDATGSFAAGLYALAGCCLVSLAATAVLARLTRPPRELSTPGSPGGRGA